MKQEYSAGTVVYYKKGRTLQFLLLEYGAGHWDFPKGHIEKGESKHEAALRELYEETGLTGIIDKKFEYEFSYFFYNPGLPGLVRKTVYFYVVESSSQEVTLSHEHKGYTWLPYQKALKQLTFKNAQELLKEAYQFLRTC